MSREALVKSLEQLRSEIHSLGVNDTAAKERMDRLIIDLEHQVANEDDHKHRASLLKQLPKLIDEFEARHPNITGIMDQIVNTLSNMGI